MSIYKFQTRFLIFFLFFSFIRINLAAQAIDSAISSISQNERWMNELEKLPLKEQVTKITKRLLLDTSVYARNSFPAEVRYSKNNGARPVYVINGFPIYLCNIESVQPVITLTNLILESEVEKINILHCKEAMALYGTRASAGVIILRTKHNKEENFQELNLGTDCQAPYICGFGRATQMAQLITTPEQNQKWLEELKTLPFNEQLKKINERLKNDASEVARKSGAKLYSKEYWDIHTIFIVNGVPVDIENLKEITKLTNELSEAQKGSVTVMDEKTQTKALFCKTQRNVVVVQTLKRKRRIKRT